MPINDCFFCGSTQRPLTEEHVRPKWVSALLRGKCGSDHFVHIRSTGSDTTGHWRSPDLKVSTKNLCDKCNNVWLGNFENRVIKPLVSPLILGDARVLLKPGDQCQIAALGVQDGHAVASGRAALWPEKGYKFN